MPSSVLHLAREVVDKAVILIYWAIKANPILITFYVPATNGFAHISPVYHRGHSMLPEHATNLIVAVYILCPIATRSNSIRMCSTRPQLMVPVQFYEGSVEEIIGFLYMPIV